MLYETPKNILEMKINETLKDEEENIITDLIKLSLLKKADKDPNLLIYAEIFNLLGLDLFTELISLIDGRNVSFPSKEEFKDIVVTTLVYYYRNIENKEWPEIKSLIGETNLPTIKLGIHASQLDHFIKELVNKRLGKNEEQRS